MGDKVKALKKENDDLKSQLNDLKKEFQFLESELCVKLFTRLGVDISLSEYQHCSQSSTAKYFDW